MKKTRKNVALILALASAFCTAGCNEQYDYTKTEPDYSACVDTSVMVIGAHVSPRPAFTENEVDYCTQEQYNYIAECGINMINGFNEWNGIVKNGKTAEERALEYSQNAGIQFILRGNSAIEKALRNQDETALNKAVEKYLPYPSFAGVFINDEPSCTEFEDLTRLKIGWDALLPEKLFYVNLYPMIASTSQLGLKEGESYQEHHIRRYLEDIKPEFLSYDHYPLKEDGWGEPSIEAPLLLNLQICAEEAKRANVPLWNHIQAYRFNTGYRAPNESEIRFQVMCSMAYGVKGYQYFSYWNHEDDIGLLATESALMSRTGERTEAYYAAQKVNREVLAIDHVYLNYDWEGTMCILGEGNKKNKCFSMLNNPLQAHDRIKAVKASQDTIIGTFKDKDGNDAFMLVNFSDPANGLNDRIEIDLKGASKAVCYTNGVRNVVEAKKGKLNLELVPGNGVFVIPLQ